MADAGAGPPRRNTIQRHKPAPYRPTGSDVQRFRDFIAGSRPPTVAASGPLLAAAFGASSSSTVARQQVNPQGGEDGETPRSAEGDEAASKDVFAEFLFVKATPVTTTRAVVAHVGNLIYAAAYEMVMVVLPYVNEKLGGTVLTFSDLRAGSNVLSLIGGIMVGVLSDKVGPKKALLLSHASAAASFSLVGMAGSMRVLYCSALPVLTMHAYQATLHVVTLNSDEPQRARALGRVGAVYGMGFFLGSVGMLGVLPLMSPQAIALLAAGLEVMVVGVVAACYPSDDDDGAARSALQLPLGEEEGGAGEGSSEDSAGVASFFHVLQRPGVMPLLTFKFLVVTAAGSVLFMVQQFAMQPFGFTVSQSALLIAYLGGVQLVSQALVTDDVSPRSVYLFSALSVGGCLLGMAATPPTKHAFVLWLAPLALFFNISRTMLGSLLTLYVPQEEMGAVLGFSVATVSVGHIVAVPIAARVFHAHGFSAVPLAAGIWLLVKSASILLIGFTPPTLDVAGESEPDRDASSS